MHTKQQWLVDGTTVYALEHDGWKRGEEQFRNRFYAGVQGRGQTPKEELEANARLMAAAPELLALLIESQDYIGGDWRERRDAVVAKALGEKS